MKTISLTVPMDYNALTRASDMLHGMALDLSKEQPIVTKKIVEILAGDVGENIEKVTPGLAATEIFGDPKPAAALAAEVQQKADSTQAPVINATESSPTPADSAVEPDKALSGVELDSDKLPWDHRIHSLGAGGAHNKLKKTEQWKKKRGISAELITQVEAELHAAMAAGPANPVVTTTPQEKTPAPAPALAVQEKTPAPAPALGTVNTFPELMAAITTNRIDEATVLAAVNTQGLTSLMLVATRADLIPAIAKALGV